MADRDGGQGQLWDDSTQQYAVEHAADPATIQAKHGGRRGHSNTQPPRSRDLQGKNVYLDAGAPGETVSGAWGLSGLHRAKIGCISGVQEAFRRSTGGAAGVRRAKIPYFAYSKAYLAAFSRKTAGKSRRRV